MDRFKIKVVVFDFDGVIVDSESIKQEGYEYMFTDYDEVAPTHSIKKARDLYSDGRGTGFDIIRAILHDMGVDYSNKIVEFWYTNRYAPSVKTRILKLRVPGEVHDTLSALSKKLPLYINSMNPSIHLLEYAQNLNVAIYFKELLGGSATKIQNLNKVLQLENVIPNEVLFIGDAMGDYNAAKKCGCQFIGFINVTNGWDKDMGLPFEVIKNIHEVFEYV